MYKFKEELVFFDSVDEKQLFYAPTLGICMLCTHELSEKMQKHLRGEIDFPEFGEMLEAAWNSRVEVYDLGTVKSKFFHIALGLTENCTLACKYCHADAGKPTMMSKELITEAANYAKSKVIEEGLKGINLSFAVGGEPTFHLELLKNAIEAFKNAAADAKTTLKTSMTTNGYYGAELAEYIADTIDNVLISIDGTKDIQDTHRPARGGGGSYEKVLRSMDIVYDRKGELNVRSTISALSVGKMNDFIDFLAQSYNGNVTWVVEPLVPLGRGASCGEDGIEPPDNMEFADNYWKAYLYGKSKGISVKTSALNVGRLVTGFCGAMYIPSFTLTTAGKITTCERDSTGSNYGYGYFDEISKKFIIDEAKVQRNKDLVQMPDKCLSCICRYHCAGDCPDVRTIHYNRCETNRYLLKKYLMSII